MLYNSWHFESNDDGGTIFWINDYDEIDRESQRSYKPSGCPGRAWIYFPRRNQKTNDKYKKVLLDYIAKCLSDQIARDTDILNTVQRYIDIDMH